MTEEIDPSGIDAHTPGAKLDSGKLRVNLVPSRFVRALEGVGRVGSAGAEEYTDDGWLKVPNGIQRFGDAAGRHKIEIDKGEITDPKSGLPHFDHYVWNLLAVSELAKRAEEARNV